MPGTGPGGGTPLRRDMPRHQRGGGKARIGQHLPLGVPRHVGGTHGTLMAHQPRHQPEMAVGKVHHRQEPLPLGIRRRRTLQRHGHARNRTRTDTNGGRDPLRNVVPDEFAPADRVRPHHHPQRLPATAEKPRAHRPEPRPENLV